MSVRDRSCSREYSRQARKILAKNIYPYLGGDPAEAIPRECPLHPELDMFKEQEAYKSLVPGKADTFQCGYCQKQFKTEFYMDRHMDNKHADRLSLGEITDAGIGRDSGRCLGDLCPALGCGEFASNACSVEILGGGEAGAADGGGGGKKIRRGCGTCDPANMEWRTRQCIALFDGCFNASSLSGTAHRGEAGRERSRFGGLRDHFVRQFCDHLACDAHHRPLAPPLEGEWASLRHPFPPGDGRGGIGMAKAFVILVLVCGLIIFYVSMELGRRSRSTRHDLRPVKRERGADRATGGTGGASASSNISSSGQLRRRSRRVSG